MRVRERGKLGSDSVRSCDRDCAVRPAAKANPKHENAVIRSWLRRRRAATRDGLRHLRAQQLSSPDDQGSPGTVGGAAGLCRVFQIRRPHPAASGKRRSEHDSSRTPKTPAVTPRRDPGGPQVAATSALVHRPASAPRYETQGAMRSCDVSDAGRASRDLPATDPGRTPRTGCRGVPPQGHALGPPAPSHHRSS